MYCKFFGLRSLPFEERADTQFFYPTPECEEALAAMEYEIHHGTGLGLLIGEAGTGKTLLLRTLLLRLQKSDQTVVVTWPANGAMDLVRECCKGFGVTLPSSYNQSRCLNRLRRHLGRWAGAGSRSILVVDQAENLSPSNFAQLTTLTEMCGDHGKLLTIILAAQPLVRTLLDRPEFARIRQQLFGERALSQLALKETGEYIRHRLQIAGAGDTRLFDDRAVSLIHETSEGIPRLINRVCNSAMLVAYGAQSPRITRMIVEEATSRPAVRERTVAAHDLGLSMIGESGAPWLSVSESPERTAGSDESQMPPSPFVPAVTPVDIINPEEAEDAWSDANDTSGASIADGEYDGFNDKRLGSGPNEVTFLLARLERAMGRATRIASTSEASFTRLTAMKEHLAAQVERHTNDVDSRIARVSNIAAQTEDSARRVERACVLAGDVEARLTAFAERLADKADEVQHRVSTLMNGVLTTEAIQTRLAGLVEQAVSVTRTSEETLTTVRSQLRTVVEEGGRELQRRAEVELDRCERQAQERVKACEQVGQSTVEKNQAKLDSLLQRVLAASADADRTIERQRTTAGETVEAIQTKLDMLLQRVSITTAEADDKINTLTVALQRAIADGQQVHQQLTTDSLERHRVTLRDQVKILEHCAQETVDSSQAKLDAILRHVASAAADAERRVEVVAAPLKAAIVEGERFEKHLTETLPRRCREEFDSLFDQCRNSLIEELASMRRMATETVDSAKSRLDGILHHVSSATTDAKKVADDLTTRLKTAIDEPAQHGAQLLQEVRATGERITALQQQVASSLIDIGIGCERVAVARAQAGECEQIAAAREGCQAAAKQLETTVGSASQIHDALQGLVAHADEKVGRLASHHAAASHVLDRLSVANVTAHGAIERQERLCEDASAAAERLATKLTSSTSVFDAEESLLRDIAANAEALHERIKELDGKTSDLETRVADCTSGPSAIVENAQTQTAQLERVCAAVRKVFAGLAESTLKAQHQTEQLRGTSEDANVRLAELTAETKRATRTFHEWVEEAVRTQSRLERTLGECPPIGQTHPTEAVRRLSRSVEPFARIAAETAGGQLQVLTEPVFDATPVETRIAKPPTRAEEIARLISEAKQREAAAPA